MPYLFVKAVLAPDPMTAQDPRFFKDAENKAFQRYIRTSFQRELDIGSAAHWVTGWKLLHKGLETLSITTRGIEGSAQPIFQAKLKFDARPLEVLQQLKISYKLLVHGSSDTVILLKQVGRLQFLTDLGDTEQAYLQLEAAE